MSWGNTSGVGDRRGAESLLEKTEAKALYRSFVGAREAHMVPSRRLAIGVVPGPTRNDKPDTGNATPLEAWV